MVSRPVVAHEPGAVHREDDIEPLQAHVMDDLVVRALQEGRVDREHRLDALQREARGEQDRLLLGDSDVEIALRHRLLQDRQARAGVHRRGDPNDTIVPPALLHEGIAEDLGVLRGRRLRRSAAVARGSGR